MQKEFNLSKIRSIKGASITEFRLYSPKVARVIATFVGEQTPEEATERIMACLDGQATPIRSSFRWLEKNQSAIGFVTTVTPVRSYDENAVNSKYHRINANLFMDPSDETIWEVKPGSGGQYLARKGTDNLAELIEAARTSPRGSTPRMMSVMAAAARTSQFVAFVEPDANVVDYGFCVKSSTTTYQILSSTTQEVCEIPRDGVVGVYTLDIPDQVKAAISKNTDTKVKAGFTDAASAIEYYKKAYAYAPDYVESIIRQIEQQSVM